MRGRARKERERERETAHSVEKRGICYWGEGKERTTIVHCCRGIFMLILRQNGRKRKRNLKRGGGK